ncbi:MAG: acyltransferase [Patescibacteria group bacterium]
MKKTKPIAVINQIHLLKGLAIIGVICLHLLANIKAPIYFKEPWQFWAIFFDQLSRFCVPLFVSVSGFALYSGYAQVFGSSSSISYIVSFWYRRFSKLLPGFIVWSLLISLSIKAVGEWQWVGIFDNYLFKIILGQADYHLYFVPMILQLYLLFPFFVFFMKRRPLTILFMAGLWHFLLISFIDHPQVASLFNQKIITDQLQYLFFGTWIWYFVLGMFFAGRNDNEVEIGRRVSLLKSMKLFLAVVSFLTLSFSVTVAQSKIQNGLDPIIALKYTTPLATLFSTFVVMFLLQDLLDLVRSNYQLGRHRFQLLVKPLIVIGKQSFLIYLTHTLFLRIFFSYYYQIVSIPKLILPSMLLIFGLYLSRKLKI